VHFSSSPTSSWPSSRRQSLSSRLRSSTEAPRAKRRLKFMTSHGRLSAWSRAGVLLADLGSPIAMGYVEPNSRRRYADYWVVIVRDVLAESGGDAASLRAHRYTKRAGGLDHGATKIQHPEPRGGSRPRTAWRPIASRICRGSWATSSSSSCPPIGKKLERRRAAVAERVKAAASLCAHAGEAVEVKP